MQWNLITGEYPPAPGGVADYTAQLAAAFAAAGDAVEVWAPIANQVGARVVAAAATPAPPGVRLHALPRGWDRRGRARCAAALAANPEAQILLQYVPHAYGLKAMNLPFALWFAGLRVRHPWIMFHEVAFPLEPGQALPRRALALVTRHMAARLARASQRSFVSIPAWGELLRQLAPEIAAPEWLPVPSNFPAAADPAAVAALRRRSAPAGEPIIAHLGRYGAYARACLVRLLSDRWLTHPQLRIWLLGPGGEATRADILRIHPALADRILAPGFLPPAAVALHLAAADLLLQPYSDGISSRRGTAMAGLALGRPMLSTLGPLSEPLWRQSAALALAPASPDGVQQAALLRAPLAALLDDPGARCRLGAQARLLYQSHFALEHTVRVLRAAA